MPLFFSFFILGLILSWICTKPLTFLWEVAIMSWPLKLTTLSPGNSPSGEPFVSVLSVRSLNVNSTPLYIPCIKSEPSILLNEGRIGQLCKNASFVYPFGMYSITCKRSPRTLRTTYCPMSSLRSLSLFVSIYENRKNPPTNKAGISSQAESNS